MRTPAEWAVRCTLALLVAIPGYLIVSGTAGFAMRNIDSEQAHRLSPRDGRITGLLAKDLMTARKTDQRLTDEMAKAALRADPTAIPAIWTLGANAQIRGQVGAARSLFAYSQRLSRRDLPTQVWAIEDAVSRGDVSATLRHYDIALRTSHNAPQLLFPILLGAIADQNIRKALVTTLDAGPHWADGFINYVAEAGTDFKATAALFVDLQRAGVPVSNKARATVVGKLFDGGEPNGAWSYYRTMRAGVRPDRTRDPGFAGELAVPTVFDWVPVDDVNSSVSIQREGVAHYLDLTASPGYGGPLVRQAQVLPAGSYRLEGRSAGVTTSEQSAPYWTITCNNGQELARFDVSSSTMETASFGGMFVVPAACPAQMLTLVARPAYTIGGTKGRIITVQIIPAL